MNLILWIPVISAISVLAGITIGYTTAKREEKQNRRWYTSEDNEIDILGKIYGRLSKLENQVNDLASRQGLIWKKEDSLPKWVVVESSPKDKRIAELEANLEIQKEDKEFWAGRAEMSCEELGEWVEELEQELKKVKGVIINELL